MIKKGKPKELENHHNQVITETAAKRIEQKIVDRPTKKVVVLRLSEEEQRAFEKIGGVGGLKKLLREAGEA